MNKKGPKRIEGRIGEATEYVEFEASAMRRIVAQKGAGGFWFVYDVRRDNIKTIGEFDDKDSAVKEAQKIAEAI